MFLASTVMAVLYVQCAMKLGSRKLTTFLVGEVRFEVGNMVGIAHI
jgi:hypothetical protein